MRLLTIAVGTLAWLLAAAPSAYASDADCDVYEIEASDDAGGIDKGLDAKLGKVLKKAPFTSWKSFKLLKKHTKPVDENKPVSFDLTTAGKLTLNLKGVEAKPGKKKRLRIQATMHGKDGKQQLETTSSVDSGDAWLIGGEPLPAKPKSTYFVGIACTAK